MDIAPQPPQGKQGEREGGGGRREGRRGEGRRGVEGKARGEKRKSTCSTSREGGGVKREEGGGGRGGEGRGGGR